MKGPGDVASAPGRVHTWSEVQHHERYRRTGSSRDARTGAFRLRQARMLEKTPLRQRKRVLWPTQGDRSPARIWLLRNMRQATAERQYNRLLPGPSVRVPPAVHDGWRN